MLKIDKKTENLYRAILAIETLTEAKRFFRDLLTEKEIKEFSNRWQAAQMLFNKQVYPEIQKATGLSTRTIARISKWLNQGMGGYKLILSKLAKKDHHGSSFYFEKS